MTVTLKPVLDSLGYTNATQQRAVVKLLQAAGAFGQVEGVEGILCDKKADAILNNLTFNDLPQAAKLLHEITQASMLRPKGIERCDCKEPPHYKTHRAELIQAFQDAGLMDSAKPTQKYYDHVLVMGTTQAGVDNRLDYLKQLWDAGTRFGKIHLLGSERQLMDMEKSAGKPGANGKDSRIEMDMMETRYYAKSASWPKEMQAVRVFEVNTYNKPDGSRANTRDTAHSWKATNPEAGEVLVVSSQPYVKFQDAAVKAELPRGFHVETVGDKAPPDMKIALGMDTIARQIDAGFAKLQERMKMRKPKLEAQLVLVDPKDVLVDAATYQFRSGGDGAGVTAKGRYNATRWDPILHGDPILVHERLDGRVFVADGHHRLDLAKTLNASGSGPGKMAAMVLREADGYTPQDVKIIAAYKNIAHGKTDAVDTARVFKEAHNGSVNLDLLPHLQMDKGNLRMAFTMSKLSDGVLDQIQKDNIPAEAAALLAEKAPNDPERQGRVLALVKQKLATQEYKVVEPAVATQVSVNMALPKDFNAQPGYMKKISEQRMVQQSVSMNLAG